MRNINKVLIGATVVGAGIATVGIGAGANFVDSPSTTQSVQTGTLLTTLNSGGVSSTSTAVTPANIALAALANEPSNFKNYKDIAATNSGTLAGTVSSIVLSQTGDTGSLGADASTTISLVKPGDPVTTSTQLCSGTIAHCTGSNLLTSSFVAPSGSTWHILVSTYAGLNTGAASLTNVDEGKAIVETLTASVSNTDSNG
jgi:hypothetical protein